MRNLKKLLAVILTVVMIASMMVPALAANTYEDEALKLQSIGMFAGEPADLKLEEGVSRIQGLAFAIRAAGKEADAFAMTDEEVTTILADWTDADTIPAWGLKYAAYAIKNTITLGLSTTEKIFGGLEPISGTSFLVFLMRSGMGYADVTTANVVEASVTAGILTAGQAAQFGAKAALIRDDAAGILYGAAMNGVNADGTPLIEALIASGFVDRDAALEAGFVEEVVPEELEVVSVEADNLVRVIVTFNKPVDKDTIENGDFEVDGADVASSDVSLSDDKTVATLTVPVMSNGDEISIEISGISDLDGNEMEDYEGEFTPMDVDQPRVESIEFTGPETAKITFSEPMDGTVTGEEIIIDGGIYSASPAAYDNTNEVEINLGTELDEGEHTFKIKGFKDYAGYSNLVVTLTVDYEAIDEAPSVTVKEAKQSYVILKFERPVTDIEVEDFYQTYTNWKPLEVQNEDGNALVGEWADTVRLVFTDAERLVPTDDDDDDRPLPVGNTKIVIVDEAVEDRWGNVNDGDIILYATITADDVKPEVTKISVESESQIFVYFSEAVVASDAEDDGNYVIKDSKGDTISSAKWNAENYNSDDKYVEINFNDPLDNGDYTITIEAIADTSIAKNTLDTVTLTFTITDKSAGISGTVAAWVDTDKVLYVKYNEAMDSTTVLNKDNYRINNSELASNVKLSMFTSKIVKMQFPSTTADLAGDTLTIGRVKDSAGNVVEALATDVTITDEVAPTITAVKKIAENKFELTVNQELKSISSGAIKVDFDGAGVTSPANASYKFVNDGDETTITVTVPTAHKDPGTEAVTSTYEIIIVADKIKSVTGVAIESVTIVAGGALGDFEDGVAPKLAEFNDDKVVYAYDSDGNDKVDHFILKYSEAINAGTVSKYTYAVDGYKVLAVVVVNATDMDDARTAIDSGLTSSVDGAYVVVVVEELDDEDIDQTTSVTQKYSIEDLASNELAPQKSVKAISAEEAETLNP